MSNNQSNFLPEYEKPPVVEVAVMVQFEAPSLRIHQIMHWWSRIKDEYPGLEQAPAIQTATESFDISKISHPKVQFQLLDSPPVPRLFLKKAADTELIQIQQDKFGYSWRKLEPKDDYPRYTAIRSSFEKQLILFNEFLLNENIEPMIPTLCEVTYVNHILGSGIWHNHNELYKVIPSVTPKLTDDFLPLPEDMQFTTRYIMSKNDGEPLGRLYVSLEPRFLTADMTPIFLMRLTARGAPRGKGQESILEVFDLGHEWIVRAFTTLTSSEMHKAWERTI